MSQSHTFDKKIATEYGLEEAIVFQRIYDWVEKNMANDMHCYNGHYWAESSCSAFLKILPYLQNAQKVQRVLASLTKNDLIKVQKFHKNKFNQTNWYTITEKGANLVGTECLKMNDRMFKNDLSYIYILRTHARPLSNTLINTLIKEKENKQRKRKSSTNSLLNGKNLNLNIPTPHSPPPSDFDLFWQAYPNKKSKGGARKAWDRAVKSGTIPAISEILKAIEAQKKWRETASRREFRPEWKHPQTWINQECWGDEVEIKQNDDDKILIDGAYYNRRDVFYYQGEWKIKSQDPMLFRELKEKGEID